MNFKPIILSISTSIITLILYNKIKDYFYYRKIKIYSNNGGEAVITGSKDSIGVDLTLSKDHTIPPFTTIKLDNGINTTMPDDIVGLITPRSSTNLAGVLFVKTGVIDPDYRGPISTVVENVTSLPIELKKGDRVSQLLFLKAIPPKMIVKNNSYRIRGIGGFGSSNSHKSA